MEAIESSKSEMLKALSWRRMWPMHYFKKPRLAEGQNSRGPQRITDSFQEDTGDVWGEQ